MLFRTNTWQWAELGQNLVERLIVAAIKEAIVFGGKTSFAIIHEKVKHTIRKCSYR